MISIITATFNAQETIIDNLKSLSSQTVDIEHIIVDGASWDATKDKIQAARLPNSTVISEPDNGIYDAMNKGIQLAHGNILGILNADDFYAHSNVLERVIESFGDPTVEACYGDLCYVDCENTTKVIRYWKAGPYNYQKFYWGWMPPHPTFFVRKSIYAKYGVFNLNLGSAADYELMLRFLVKNRVKTVYIPEILVHMRTGGVSNAAFGNRMKANRMDREAWTVNKLTPYPWTLIAKPLRKIPQWWQKPQVN